MRLIDADRLNKVLDINFRHTSGADVLKQLIDIQPTIQAVPIEVLDKIRDEIRKQNIADFIAVQSVLEIIDQYRKEQE